MSLGLVELQVGGDVSAWREAGFSVGPDDRIALGPLDLVVGNVAVGFGLATGPDGDIVPPGGADRLLGIPLTTTDRAPGTATPHPNGVDGFDHVVVMAPSLSQVRDELAAVGVEVRRERPTTIAGRDVVQVFAWAGAALLEIVAPVDVPDPSDAPAGPHGLWGVALTATDLDATAAWAGDLASPPRPAVQPGRRILSLRRRALGLPLEVAVMSAREGG